MNYGKKLENEQYRITDEEFIKKANEIWKKITNKTCENIYDAS